MHEELDKVLHGKVYSLDLLILDQQVLYSKYQVYHQINVQISLVKLIIIIMGNLILTIIN